MKIAIQCPECHAKISAPAETAGKRVRCPKCEKFFIAKSASAAANKPAPEPARYKSSRRVVVVALGAAGLIAAAAGVYLAFFNQRTPEPTPKVAVEVESKSDLKSFLAGTVWKDDAAALELKPDGLAQHPRWNEQHIVVRWEPIDRRTLLFRVVGGRTNDRYAIAKLSEKLDSFELVPFTKGDAATNYTRVVGDSESFEVSPSAKPGTRTGQNLHNDLAATGWNWGDGQLSLMADGRAYHPSWDERQKLRTRWTAIDQATVLLEIEKGRVVDRLAILTFFDDQSEFTGWDFIYADAISPRRRIPQAEMPTPPPPEPELEFSIPPEVKLASYNLTAHGLKLTVDLPQNSRLSRGTGREIVRMQRGDGPNPWMNIAISAVTTESRNEEKKQLIAGAKSVLIDQPDEILVELPRSEFSLRRWISFAGETFQFASSPNIVNRKAAEYIAAALRSARQLPTQAEANSLDADALTAIRSLGTLYLRRPFPTLRFTPESHVAESLAAAKRLAIVRLEFIDVPLEIDTVSRIAEWGSVKELLLAGPSIDDRTAAQLAGIKGIERLEFRRTQITDAGLKSLETLNGLKGLILCRGDCEVTARGLDSLNAFRAMEDLQLDGLPFGPMTMKLIGGMQNLERLSLRGVELQALALTSLQGTMKLEELDLSHALILDSPGVKGLRGLEGVTSLKRLSLARTRANGTLIKSVPTLINLEFLDLSGTNAGDSAVSKLPDMKRLKAVRLRYLTLSKPVLDDVQRRMPGIAVDRGEERP